MQGSRPRSHISNFQKRLPVSPLCWCCIRLPYYELLLKRFLYTESKRIRQNKYKSQNNEVGTPFEPHRGETLEKQPHYFAGLLKNSLMCLPVDNVKRKRCSLSRNRIYFHCILEFKSNRRLSAPLQRYIIWRNRYGNS